MRRAPTRPEEMSEADFCRQLFSTSRTHPGVATVLGWSPVYHTFRSQKSPTGFPDWVLVRERVIFAETKTETGKVSDEQQRWINALRRAGAEAYVWRPSGFDEIAAILNHRGSPPAPCEWCGRLFVHLATCGPALEVAS